MNQTVLPPQPVRLALQGMRKVPEVTLYFWLIKLLTTAMGEATSDFLVYHLSPYLAVGLGFVGLIAALGLQFYVRRYIPWIYWLAVVMVAVFGTMAADVLHVELHISYLTSTAFFAVVLAAIFIIWYMSEKTLSIHSITNARREVFYWATVIATFALGTAAGDLTANTLHLGYLASAGVFAVLFALPLLVYRVSGLGEVATFWLAYIMTRPLGASFADYFGKSALDGLGLGDTKVALVLTILIVILVWYVTVTHKDTNDQHL